jgi:hypothetical protein
LRTPEAWRAYLQEYIEAGVRAGMLDSRWEGREPATEETIATAERRLGVSFPPSYRSFLLTTDGWNDAGCWIGHVYACADVVWLREDEEGWGEEFIDLYRGEAGLEEYVSVFERTLKVSNGEDFWFLDPTETDPDGEWAAYVFTPKYGDLKKVPGFAHLWHENHRTFDTIAASGAPSE